MKFYIVTTIKYHAYLKQQNFQMGEHLNMIFISDMN